MESGSAHRTRRPLQPRIRTEQAGPTSEGVGVAAHEGKARGDIPSNTSSGVPQSSSAKRDKKEKTACLAISLNFLAPPVGRSAEELSVEEVRMANILDSWGAPDDDGSLAPSTRQCVRAHGTISRPIGARPSWLDPLEASAETVPAKENPADGVSSHAAKKAGADRGGLRLRDQDIGTGHRRRSMRHQSTVNLAFTIHEDTEILDFDNDTKPMYTRSAQTAPLPRRSPRDGGGQDMHEGPDSTVEPMSPDVGRFARVNDTIELSRQGKGVIKRAPVSPFEDEETEEINDAARRVRFQPSSAKDDAATGKDRFKDAAFALAPDGVVPFDVFPDASGQHDARGGVTEGTGAASERGSTFDVREDTEVIDRRALHVAGEDEVREDTEVIDRQALAQAGVSAARKDPARAPRRGLRSREGPAVKDGDAAAAAALGRGLSSEFDVREDTEVIDRRTLGQGGAFCVREDTEVINRRALGDRGSFAVREDTEAIDRRAVAQDGAFAVREDTEVINRRAVRGSGSLAVREDTEVIDRRALRGSGSLAVREDTEVIDRRALRGSGSLAVREDTEVIDRRALEGSGSIAVREDTEVFDRRALEGSGSLAVRQDTEVFDRRALAQAGTFAVREDKEVIDRQALAQAGPFAVREDTEVIYRQALAEAGPFAVREDTEVIDRRALAQHGKFDGRGDAGAGRAHGRTALGQVDGSAPKPGGLGAAQARTCLVREDTAPASRDDSTSLRGSRRLREGTARRRLQFGSEELPPSNVPMALAPAGTAAAAQPTAPDLLKAAEPPSPTLDEFSVLEDAQSPHADACDGGDPGSQSSLDGNEDAENAGVQRAAPRPCAGGDMLCTLEDHPDEMIKWGECGSDCGSEWDQGAVSASTSPLRRGGSTGLGAGTPGASPLRNQSPHHGRPPLSPNKGLPGHMRRALSVQAAPTALPPVRRPGALQSAVATLNPFQESFTASNLKKLGPLGEVQGVIEVPEKDLQAFVAAICSRKPTAIPGLSVAAGSSLLGRGAYAAVYRAPLAALSPAGDCGEDVALKVAAPAAPWEFAVVRALVSRVRPRYAPLFMPARCIVLSSAANANAADHPPRRAALARKQEGPRSSVSVLAMPLGRHGTLLDLVNAHKATGRELGSTLVLYLSLQLVLALHAMQRARIIHTDIKPDNCLLSWPRQLLAGTAGGAPRWTAAAAEREGSEWAGGCMQIIDFGRAIDLELLPAGTQFIGSSTTEGMQCPEMLEAKPWHFCHDAFCVAATMHALLLGKYIDMTVAQPLSGASPRPVFRPATAVPHSNPRKALWDRVLRTLLNCPLAPERPDMTPLISELSAELEASEAAAPQLWQEMQSAESVVTAYTARR